MLYTGTSVASQCLTQEVAGYRLQRSCRKVMFLHMCVILFTGGISVQGGPLSKGGSLSRWVSVQEGFSVREVVSVQGRGTLSRGSLSGRPPIQ